MIDTERQGRSNIGRSIMSEEGNQSNGTESLSKSIIREKFPETKRLETQY